MSVPGLGCNDRQPTGAATFMIGRHPSWRSRPTLPPDDVHRPDGADDGFAVDPADAGARVAGGRRRPLRRPTPAHVQPADAGALLPADSGARCAGCTRLGVRRTRRRPGPTPVELQGAFAACDATFGVDEPADRGPLGRPGWQRWSARAVSRLLKSHSTWSAGVPSRWRASDHQGQGTRCHTPRLAAGYPPRVNHSSPLPGQATAA